MINATDGIVKILKQEGVEWVSTFPVCKINNALGREGIPMIMMRDDRFAIAVADAIAAGLAAKVTAHNVAVDGEPGTTKTVYLVPVKILCLAGVLAGVRRTPTIFIVSGDRCG